MPLYKYKVMDSKGKKIVGTYQANNKDDVIAMLRGEKYYPITIEEQKNNSIKITLFEGKVSLKELSIFCRQFHTMINSGMSMLNSLELQRKQVSNKKFKKALDEVYEDVQKGQTLSESMDKHKDVFPELLVNMVASGEVSGNLDSILGRMADHYEKENKITSKIKGAMVYPIVLSIVAVGVVIFLLTFVMPTFVNMFESSGVELPGPTRVVLAISSGLKNYWYIIAPVILLIVFGVAGIKKTDKGKLFFEKLKLTLPIIKSTNEKIIISRFTRSMSTILASGVTIVEAIEITGRIVGNKLIEEKLKDSKEKMMRGTPLSEAISDIKLFPEMLLAMVKVGEESGALEEILDKTAYFYEEEVEAALQRLATLVEPAMILVMGLLVGGIVIAMVLPMFDMYNTMQ